MKKSASTSALQFAPSSVLSPPPSVPLHLDYQIHWRTEFRWRTAHLALTGTHPAKALTPESACEAFAEKFPGRDITSIVAL